MTINSLSNSYSAYTNLSNYYQTTQTSDSDSESSTDTFSVQGSQQGGQGGPGGPGGPGGAGGAGGGTGPDLDSDSDDYWSASEIEDYADYSSDSLGISLDSDSIISKYDTDGDGQISESERESLAQDNAFQLPTPQRSMDSITSETDDSSDTTTELINSNSISNYLNAYTSNQSYNSENLKSMLEITA
jgi:hypothetical protein